MVTQTCQHHWKKMNLGQSDLRGVRSPHCIDPRDAQNSAGRGVGSDLTLRLAQFYTGRAIEVSFHGKRLLGRLSLFVVTQFLKLSFKLIYYKYTLLLALGNYDSQIVRDHKRAIVVCERDCNSSCILCDHSEIICSRCRWTQLSH